MQRAWAAAYFGKHSSRIPGDGYNIMGTFFKYQPDFEVEGVRSKRSASFPTGSFTELHSAIFDTFVNDGSWDEDVARFFGVQLSVSVSTQKNENGQAKGNARYTLTSQL